MDIICKYCSAIFSKKTEPNKTQDRVYLTYFSYKIEGGAMFIAAHLSSKIEGRTMFISPYYT